MKFKYSAIVLALLASNTLQANEVKQLEMSEVEAIDEQASIEVSGKVLELKQVNDLKGALNHLAGVSVSNGSRYGQKTYLRGVEEHSANITIDGVRQDGQLFHHSGNQVLDTSMFKAVSVELGAASVLSGYGAITGAIKYQTKNPSDLLAPGDTFGANGALGMDTATEFRQVSINGYGRINEQLSLLTMITANENGDIDTPNADPIVNKHSELQSGLVKAVYDFDRAQTLTLNLQSVKDGGNRAFSGEKPGMSELEREELYNGYQRDTYSLMYINDSVDPLLDLYINVYFNEKSMNREQSTGANWIRDDQGQWQEDGTAFYPERDYFYQTTGLDIRNTSLVNGLAWTYGLESFKSEQRIEAKGLQKTTTAQGEVSTRDLSVANGPTARLIGAYIQTEVSVGELIITPGIRYDSYQLGGAYDLSFNKLSPKLSASWQANQDLNLTLGYGQTFKGPGLPEVLMINNQTSQGEGVEAEGGNYLELKGKYDLAGTLDLQSALVYANVYQFTIDDSFHPTKNTTLTRGRFDLKNNGAEAGFRFSHQQLSGYINYSYNDGERDYSDYKTDDLYSGTHEVNIGLTYQASDEWLLGWDNSLVDNAALSDTYINRQGELVTEVVEKVGYGVANLWVSYEPKSVAGLRINVAMDNVFDKAYQHHKSFGMYWGNAEYNDNEVGRNIKASVSYQF